MILAGIFSAVGGIQFAVIAATFVPAEDIDNSFEVHLFGATASVFGVLTGLCCCCGSVLCCCTLRKEKVQVGLVHIQEQGTKFRELHVESSL